MNEKLIEFCAKIIQQESISGDEQAVASLIFTEMEQLGYDEVRYDAYGNVIGKICGLKTVSDGKNPLTSEKLKDRTVLFEGHMDTVGVPSKEAWSLNPYSGEIRDGRLYGRGSADMKSALAAMVYAGAELIEQKEILAGDVYVCAVVYEETLEGVAFGKVLDDIHPDFVIIGEPSDMKLALGQKGRAEIVLETEGRNAHSATPDNGINAINMMHELVSQIQDIPLQESTFLGKGIMEITDIVSEPYPGSSVVPNYCRATYDRRLIEKETASAVLQPIETIIKDLQKQKSVFEAHVSIAYTSEKTYTECSLEASRFFPGWIIDRESPLAFAVHEAYQRLGIAFETCYYPFCTDGSESAGKRDIPTIGIGPAPPEMAHVVDEYVVIENIYKVKELYRETAVSLLGKEVR